MMVDSTTYIKKIMKSEHTQSAFYHYEGDDNIGENNGHHHC